MRAIFAILGLLSLSGEFASAACPGPEAFPAEAAPLCPASGTLLDDSYPLMALTISDNIGGPAGVLRTAEEVFAAQPSPLPLIFVNASPAGFAELQALAAKRPGWTPAKSARLRPVFAKSIDDFDIVDSFTDPWQQDYIKGSFDPATGRPRSRIVPTYDLVGDIKEALSKALAACGIAEDPPLPAPSKRNGYSGGNFDAVPGGACVLGASDLKPAAWRDYAAGVCAGRETFSAPSAWASSGHADEIFKAFPLAGGGACDFALAFASPRRALELLSEAPAEDALHPGSRAPRDFDHLLGEAPGLRAACGVYQENEFKKTRNYTLAPIEWRTTDGKPLLLPAGTGYLRGVGVSCASLTNGRLAELVRGDPVMRETNELTQSEMDHFKEEVRAFYARRLPQCGAIKMIDLPTLYAGRIVVEKNGAHRLGRLDESTAVSAVFPTPTNSVIVGRTILVPDPHNRALERGTRAALEGAGFRVRFVDTLESHAVLGNLHCTTQTFRYCRPR